MYSSLSPALRVVVVIVAPIFFFTTGFVVFPTLFRLTFVISFEAVSIFLPEL